MFWIGLVDGPFFGGKGIFGPTGTSVSATVGPESLINSVLLSLHSSRLDVVGSSSPAVL